MKHVADFYLEADGLLDVRHSELLQETIVFAPEQTDVGDAVQNHRQPLEAETERPTRFVPCSGCETQTQQGMLE